MYHLTALLMRGHWWCVGYIYIGSAADGVRIVLTITCEIRDIQQG